MEPENFSAAAVQRERDSVIARLVALMQRRALAVALIALALGAGLAWYTAGHLSVDTDNKNMLSPELAWRKAESQLDRLFPGNAGSLVLVIDAATPELADDAQRRMAGALRGEPALFKEISATEIEPYFRRNGLLYLGEAELQKLADDLTQAQPFLGALNNDPSLHGLFGLLGRAVTHAEAADFDMSTALGQIAEGVDAAAQNKFWRLSWQGLLGGPARPDATRRFITVDAVKDYTQLLPAEKPINRVRALARELALDAQHGVSVRMTGSTAMEHQELQTAFGGIGLVLGAGLAMVIVLLYLALRSLRLVVCAVLTLVYGLLATAAFAAASIGHLNLISVAFSVLYVGLGLDYALYLCMQYRELVGQGLTHRVALPRAAREVGGFMLVCAATTSLGFFAFVPTPFTGIAELGIISGAGMFISLALSLTLLPALIALLPPDAERIKLTPSSGGWIGRALAWPYTYSRQIWIGAALLALGSLALAPRARFDYDPINLRDPKAESVATFRDLVRDPNIPTLTLSAVAPDAASAQVLSDRLGKLSLVRRAMSLNDLVPRAQDAKLAIIQDLSFTLGPALSSSGAIKLRVNDAEDRAAIEDLRAALPAYVKTQSGARAAKAQALSDALEKFHGALEKSDAAGQARLLAALREDLLAAIPAHLDDLKTSLQADHVGENDLPPSMLSSWKSADGHYRVEVWPKETLDNPDAIDRFVDQVRATYPDAVGGPLGMRESGRAVVSAFKQAFVYSFIAITLLLLLLLRSVGDTVLVLIPLTLAGLLTLAGTVVFNIPFNFANVIALPLILGVGVDYGVYLVQRGRAAGSEVNILQTSTARAVLYGALITMANFGNLALAPHPGMVSMGLLLTIGLGMTLICALVLLPSLLARRRKA